MPTLKVWDGSAWVEVKGDKGDPGEVTNAALESRVAPIEGDVSAIDTRVTTVETETAQVVVKTDVLAALRFDAADPAYGAVRGAVSPAQRTANLAAIQLAADDARDTGGTLVVKGEYELSGTLTLACHVDGLSGQFTYFDEDIAPAVRVGTTTPGAANLVRRKRIDLPAIVQTVKSGGMGVWANSVGVEIANLDSSFVTLPHVRWFGENVRVTAYGQGTAYNTFNIGHLDNGRVNLHLVPGDTGAWINENLFIGGRLSHNSAEGSGLANVHHILVSPSPPEGWGNPNSNLFLKPSIEGNVPLYHVECFGPNNTWLQARWEATTPRIRFNGTSAWLNTVAWGYGVDDLNVLYANGAHRNQVYRTEGMDLIFNATGQGAFIHNDGTRMLHGGTFPGLVVQNTSSSSNPAFVVIPAGANPDQADANWVIRAQGNSFAVKATGNTQARWEVLPTTGSMIWSDGANPADVGLSRRSAGVLALSGRQAFATGAGTTAQRPSASSVGVGAQIYDTTLNKPIWSDGSQWRDATGTVV